MSVVAGVRKETRTPALVLRLGNAPCECRGSDVPVVRVRASRRLSNHDLAGRNAACDDLEDGRLRPRRRRSRQEVGTGCVLRLAL